MDALKDSEPSEAWDESLEGRRALAGIIALICLVVLVAIVVTGH